MNLKQLQKHLEDHTAEELFGDKGKDHPDYRKWAVICHPDKNDGKDETFKLLEQRATGHIPS